MLFNILASSILSTPLTTRKNSNSPPLSGQSTLYKSKKLVNTQQRSQNLPSLAISFGATPSFSPNESWYEEGSEVPPFITGSPFNLGPPSNQGSKATPFSLSAS